MSGVEIVAIAYLGVVLILGLVALLRARQADIPAVARALGRFTLIADWQEASWR